MLNSLASYLLGYPGSSSPAAAAATSPSRAVEGDATITVDVPSADSAALPGVDVRLSAVEADDDWLLVDRTDDDCPEGSASAAVTVPAATAAARLTLAVSTTSYHWPDSDDVAAASRPLEESWFVTPPPCFTSGSVPLETSPLENLLIEHPSMSVYHRSAAPAAAATPLSSSVGASPPARSPQRGSAASAHAAALRRCRQGPAKQGNQGSKQAAVAAETSAPPRTASPSGASSPASGPSGAAAVAVERGAHSPTRSSSPNPAQTTAVQASPRRPNAFSPYQQQQQQSVQYRTAQKLVQRAACQQLKRDSLERNNKAREIRSSRNKRQRRSDHMQHHSGANNNRKC
ncbi:mucin-1 isoform X2 [Thrips palmi]|nr:mucin-1 isoform X2 [Thrips palmi]